MSICNAKLSKVEDNYVIKGILNSDCGKIKDLPFEINDQYKILSLLGKIAKEKGYYNPNDIFWEKDYLEELVSTDKEFKVYLESSEGCVCKNPDDIKLVSIFDCDTYKTNKMKQFQIIVDKKYNETSLFEKIKHLEGIEIPHYLYPENSYKIIGTVKRKSISEPLEYIDIMVQVIKEKYDVLVTHIYFDTNNKARVY